METYLLCHLPDVICDIVLSYHLFFERNQCQQHLNLIYALPYNDDYFFGITPNSLVRCCTQTLRTTCLLSISNSFTFLRLDANRLVIFAENGIYIYHIDTRTHTYCKHKLCHLYYHHVASIGSIVYFCDQSRLYIYDTVTTKITSRTYRHPIISLHVFRDTLIVRTLFAFYYIGSCLLAHLPLGLHKKSYFLIPYEHGIVINQWDVGPQIYVFGKWMEGPLIRQFLKLPDHNYVALHVFHLTFYVQQKPVLTMNLDVVMNNYFVVKNRLFCFTSNKVVIIG